MGSAYLKRLKKVNAKAERILTEAKIPFNQERFGLKGLCIFKGEENISRLSSMTNDLGKIDDFHFLKAQGARLNWKPELIAIGGIKSTAAAKKRSRGAFGGRRDIRGSNPFCFDSRKREKTRRSFLGRPPCIISGITF